MGAAGKASWLWVIAPLAALIPAGLFARKHGRKIVWLAACLVFLSIGLYLGHSRFVSWDGRGGAAGEAHLVGTVEVGCRGEQGDIVDLFRVTRVLEGQASRQGDRYLLRYTDNECAQSDWGDTLEVKGTLFLFEREMGGVGGSLVAGEARILSRSGNPLLRLATAYRDVLREQVSGLEAAAAGLIEGMVLGDYRKLNARDLKAFRLTGLIHLCAASGLNLAIMAGFIVWLGRRARLPYRLILALQVPILIVYALAVGLSVPVTRATVVALLAATAYLMGRDFDFLPAMGMAMFYILWSDPGAASGVSFQLCFAAAAGMVLFYRPLCMLMRAGNSKLMALVAATVAAQLAVGPLLLYHFGEVSVLATLSNLIVVPLVPAVMALAMLSSLVGAACLPCAGILMQAAGLFARCILTAARGLAVPSWVSLRIFPFSILWIAIYYPSLAAGLLPVRGRLKSLGRVVLAGLLAAALLFGITLPLRPLGADAGMRITFIDVGQGDAVLIQAPSGVNVLVDGGLDDRVLTEDLRSRGVRYIDAVVVSHPDSDHIGGLDGALENCEVAMMVHPGTKETGQAGVLLASAEEMGVEVRVMREGDHLQLGEISLAAFGPPEKVAEGVSVNEYSLVLRAEGPGFSMLLTGDVEEEGEEMLMGCLEDLSCDILKVPHHGGFCEGNEDFFSMVEPSIAVISVGADNAYGHPSRATVEALQHGGCSVYRTDQRGDIVVRVVEGGFRVECEKQ